MATVIKDASIIGLILFLGLLPFAFTLRTVSASTIPHAAPPSVCRPRSSAKRHHRPPSVAARPAPHYALAALDGTLVGLLLCVFAQRKSNQGISKSKPADKP